MRTVDTIFFAFRVVGRLTSFANFRVFFAVVKKTRFNTLQFVRIYKSVGVLFVLSKNFQTNIRKIDVYSQQ